MNDFGSLYNEETRVKLAKDWWNAEPYSVIIVNFDREAKPFEVYTGDGIYMTTGEVVAMNYMEPEQRRIYVSKIKEERARTYHEDTGPFPYQGVDGWNKVGDEHGVLVDINCTAFRAGRRCERKLQGGEQHTYHWYNVDSNMITWRDGRTLELETEDE